jgi:hypothetical protein
MVDITSGSLEDKIEHIKKTKRKVVILLASARTGCDLDMQTMCEGALKELNELQAVLEKERDSSR